MEAIKGGIRGVSMLFGFDGTIVYKVYTVVSLPFWIGSIIVGISFLNDSCPAQPLIPVYLMVGGIVATLKCLLNIVQWATCGNIDTDEDEICTNGRVIDFILLFFFFIWTIIGNYWVSDAAKNMSFIASSSDYCNESLIIFALVFFVISDILYISRLLKFFCPCGCCDARECDCLGTGFSSYSRRQDYQSVC